MRALFLLCVCVCMCVCVLCVCVCTCVHVHLCVGNGLSGNHYILQSDISNCPAAER